MHVQNMGLRTLNMTHGVQQRLTIMVITWKVEVIGETAAKSAQMKQASIS